MTQSLLEEIKREIKEIMLDNRELFPIVNALFRYAEHNFGNDPVSVHNARRTYVALTIDMYIGLDYVIRTKLNNLSEIIVFLDSNTTQSFIISLKKSILITYANLHDADNSNKFNSLFEVNSFLFEVKKEVEVEESSPYNSW